MPEWLCRLDLSAIARQAVPAHTRSWPRLAAASLLLGAFAADAATYSELILADNPVAYYRLEEPPGATIAVDTTPNGFHATYIYSGGNTSPQLGQPGIDVNSISFTGAGTGIPHVLIPFHPELSPVKTDGLHGDAFSVECWAQPTTQPSGGLYASVLGMFGRYGSGTFVNASGWNIAQTPGPGSVWLFNMKNGPFFQTPAPINLLQWYHLAGTFDGTNLTFYINGMSQGARSAVNYLADNGSDGQIGVTQNAGSPPYTTFRGGVDEVAFYTNALTAAQILAHYQWGTNSFRALPKPPGLLSEPVSATNYSGTTASFSAVADGTPPLHYQWRRGTQPIAGATNSTYSFTCGYPADDGATFSVVVTNAVGTTNSVEVALTVLTNLNLLHEPYSITRKRGSYAAFRVVANGALPITYQWYKDALFDPIPGATNDTLWLADVPMSDDGSAYFAVVGNPFASVESAHAALSVQFRPVIDPVPGPIYSKLIVADKPVAYWRLNELEGSGPAADLAGSFDGAYLPAAGTFTFQALTGIPGETDPALGLTAGAVVSIPYALELNPVTGPWSAEAWVKPTTLDPFHFRTVFSSMWNSDFGNHVFGWNVYQHVDGVWTLNIFDGGGSSTFVSDFVHNPLVPDAWYHMVITDDLSRMRLYVNGILVGTGLQANTRFVANGINGDPAVAGGPTVFGQRSDNAFDPFDGAIDDVAFYNYALSPQQIQAHYQSGVWITAAKSGNDVVLIWSVGTLQQCDVVNGTYTEVLGAISPFTNAPSANVPKMFYRVQAQ